VQFAFFGSAAGAEAGPDLRPTPDPNLFYERRAVIGLSNISVSVGRIGFFSALENYSVIPRCLAHSVFSIKMHDTKLDESVGFCLINNELVHCIAIFKTESGDSWEFRGERGNCRPCRIEAQRG